MVDHVQLLGLKVDRNLIKKVICKSLCSNSRITTLSQQQKMEGDGVRVEIVSKEMIKPSSKTPPHLRNLKLSYLDQIARPAYFPIIFFYEANEVKGLSSSNHLQISQHLKQSLSEALVPFYPLAGRLGDTNSVVDCNDAGAEFVDARIHAHLINVFDMEEEGLKQFLPLDPTIDDPREIKTFVLVQITLFDCGGIAVGICFSHQLADCVSIMVLVETWAAAAADTRRQKLPRGSCLSFDLHNYFPPRDSLASWLPGASPPNMLGEKFVAKRFVFDKRKLQFLREKAAASSVSNPTRVELVSGFIWRSFLKAGRTESGERKKQAAFHTVNLRSRYNPLENVSGNCIMFAYAMADSEEYHDLIARLRASIRKIDSDFIGECRSGDGYVNERREFFSEFSKGEVESCSFSSWSRFPVYEVDFGWGNPVWCCTTAVPVKNLAILLSSRCGEGIEAWVNMNERNLEMLQNQMSQSFPI